LEIEKCLGCEGAAAFFFVLWLHHPSGISSKTRSIGACVSCSEPGSKTYEQFRQRVGTLLFMQKNQIFGMAAMANKDSKTAAAGGDL
jgi:hypothetical protein